MGVAAAKRPPAPRRTTTWPDGAPCRSWSAPSWPRSASRAQRRLQWRPWRKWCRAVCIHMWCRLKLWWFILSSSDFFFFSFVAVHLACFSVITEIGRCAKAYCEHTARSVPTLSDTVVTLIEMGEHRWKEAETSAILSTPQPENILFLMFASTQGSILTLCPSMPKDPREWSSLPVSLNSWRSVLSHSSHHTTVNMFYCVCETAAPVTNAPVTPKALVAGQKRVHPAHIPSHFPEFPDPHTYIKTPVSHIYQELLLCAIKLQFQGNFLLHLIQLYWGNSTSVVGTVWLSGLVHDDSNAAL